MHISQDLFARFLAWTANIIFFSAMLPQLFLNYRLKSTNGLSDLFILANFSEIFAYSGYAFCVNLPFVYKFMNLLYAASILVLVFQRFHYNVDGLSKKKDLGVYAVCLLTMLVVIFYAFNSSVWAIGFLGWFPVAIGSWKKIPQAIKVYCSKSVEGFSIAFVIITLVAYSFELLAATILKLPAPVFFNDLRGVTAYIIFLVQFVLYRNNKMVADSYEISGAYKVKNPCMNINRSTTNPDHV